MNYPTTNSGCHWKSKTWTQINRVKFPISIGTWLAYKDITTVNTINRIAYMLTTLAN